MTSLDLDGDRDAAWLLLLTLLDGLLGDIVADLGLAFLPRLAVYVSIILLPPPPDLLVMMLAAGLLPLSILSLWTLCARLPGCEPGLDPGLDTGLETLPVLV